jgi:protein arginine kinase activator
MRCDDCGNDEAVIDLTTVRDDQTRILHLCSECAAERGVQREATAGTPPLADFLAQIGKSVGRESASQGRCPTCGLTAAQLRQTGRLGCDDCYDHFELHLRGLLRRLHGGTQHMGKAPTAHHADEEDVEAQVDSLRRSLRRAVDAEDFEHAAAIRDQIRRLEERE